MGGRREGSQMSWAEYLEVMGVLIASIVVMAVYTPKFTKLNTV